MAKKTKKNLATESSGGKQIIEALTKIGEAITSDLYLEDIWASDAPRIVQNYTDHGIKHSERLFENAVKLLNASDRGPISAKEMYLLFAGIYLHDIGMQCDVMKYPNIKEHAKRLGAKFEVEFHAKSATSYTIDEQKAIRENHNYLAAAWINYAHSTCESVLGNAARTIPDDLVEDLMDICMYHTMVSCIVPMVYITTKSDCPCAVSDSYIAAIRLNIGKK